VPASSPELEVAAARPVADAPIRPARVESIDLLRGAVMVIMALDHSRDFFSAVDFDPTDLARTTPALFFTRWVTHFCAPVFMLLAGTGAWLSLSRGKSKRELTWFLLTRGAFLIVADETVMMFLWGSRAPGLPIIGATLWGLGFSMVALAALIHLPDAVIAIFGAALVLFHNAFDGVGDGTLLGTFFHAGIYPPTPASPVLWVGYSVVPWAGVMALGYVGARVLSWDPSRRRKAFLAAGLSMTAAFVLLRWSNLYGDPQKWTPDHPLLSFLNCWKYPPSLLFLLMTLGPAIAALAMLEHVRGKAAEVLLVFGRVPMFFYFAHIALLHWAALAASALTHKPLPWAASFMAPVTADQGWGLPVVYLAWILAVIALYAPCRWYMDLKRRSTFWLLGYV
jgi:uncharacterized membrane protein